MRPIRLQSVRRVARLLSAAALAIVAPSAFGQEAVTAVPRRFAEAGVPGREGFLLLRNADTLAVERFARSPELLTGDVVELGGADHRESYVATLRPDAQVSFFRLDVRPANSAHDTPPIQRSSLTFGSSPALEEMRGGGRTSRRQVPAGPGALPYLRLSLALLEQASLRAIAVGGGRVELPLIDGDGGRSFTAIVERARPDSVRIGFDGIELVAETDSSGHFLRGEIPARRVRFERVDPVGVRALAHPGYAAPAGAPYSAEEVSVRTGRGHLLAGTLTRPAGAGPFPAVVLVSGSGPQDRDATYLGTYRPFRQLADALSREGIAVLRLDDRGVGGSTGRFSVATSADFADDLRSALAFLRRRTDVDGGRLALLGESEGGLVASMVAAEEEDLRGLVMMGTPSRSGRDLTAAQVRYRLERQGLRSPGERDSIIGAVVARSDSLSRYIPWLRFILDYDPLQTAARVRVPSLILQGGTDRQVSPNQAEELAIAMRASGNRDITVRVFPYLNHLFLNDADGDPDGYPDLPSKALPPEVLSEVAEWLRSHLATAA
ncbi:MAG TPA: alpha/beta fold hydrolase [Gemmatimonadota bacterium]|jgi:dienelactone hydrolase